LKTIYSAVRATSWLPWASYEVLAWLSADATQKNINCVFGCHTDFEQGIGLLVITYFISEHQGGWSILI